VLDDDDKRAVWAVLPERLAKLPVDARAAGEAPGAG
jgi:hypothetical protein